LRFDELDIKLLPLVKKLEVEGNLFGAVNLVIDNICITLEYADKRIGSVKPTIFGIHCDEFMSKQYK